MDMDHDLNDLFRERFQGHEAAVPSGTWQGIQARMATAATPVDGGDKVADLFRERFHDHEMAVDPAVWQGISAQLGHVAVGTTATAVWGWVAAGVAAVTIGAGAIWLTDRTPVEQVPEHVVVERSADPAPPPTEDALVTVGPEMSEDHERTIPIALAPERATPRATVPTIVQPAAEAGEVGRTVDPEEEIVTATPVRMLPVAPAENPMLVEAIVSEMTAQADAAFEAEKEGRKPEPVTDTVGPDEDAIDPFPVADQPKLFLPNTFTPNGDGHNDLYLVGGVEYFDQVMVRVYSVKDNRLVFSTNSNEPWSGDDCAEGYYLVAVEAVAPDGRLVTEGKVVFLNRTRLN
jgi:hypothetical protein